MKHKKLPQRRKERRGNDEKINSQLRRVGKSIKPLRILCDLCASAVNNFVMMFHKWDTLLNNCLCLCRKTSSSEANGLSVNIFANFGIPIFLPLLFMKISLQHLCMLSLTHFIKGRFETCPLQSYYCLQERTGCSIRP